MFYSHESWLIAIVWVCNRFLYSPELWATDRLISCQVSNCIIFLSTLDPSSCMIRCYNCIFGAMGRMGYNLVGRNSTSTFLFQNWVQRLPATSSALAASKTTSWSPRRCRLPGLVRPSSRPPPRPCPSWGWRLSRQSPPTWQSSLKGFIF